MNVESMGGKFKLNPEEQKQHEEVLRRKSILRNLEGEKARKQLEEASKKLTPEEQERGWQEIKERE
ncbi:MAG: hypothetical protein Q7K16_00485 [Candidatus Azambacteria bacterium]|nr:hypothetical protein [Candidatus Azambacteria bacterium]